MFETIVIHGSSDKPTNEPVRWLATQDGLQPTPDDYSRLMHQLNTLNPEPSLPSRTQHPHIALRRTKRLKIFVSELFRLRSHETAPFTGQIPSGQRDTQGIAQHLMLTLPAIIRSLGNLRETTLYISSHDPDDFIRNVTQALFVPPHMSILNINLLDQRAARALPIASGQGLESVKISWPIGGPDPTSEGGALSLSSPPNTTPTGQEVDGQVSIYRTIVSSGTQLKRLELSAKSRLPSGSATLKLMALPLLEELVLENVPVKLEGETAVQMPNLRSLRLAGYDCLNCDPYAGLFTSLKNVGRNLRVVGVDVVGQALVDYLGSYEGLEALVLTLSQNANDYCVKELCERGLRYHERTLKLLHVDLHPASDMRLTWFFEYWVKWLPDLQKLGILKVTTSMNLGSEFDAESLMNAVLDVVAQSPTLRKVTIRHSHEADANMLNTAERVFGNQAADYPLKALMKPARAAPSCLVVLQSFQELYRVVLDCGEGPHGSLRIFQCEE